MNLAARRSTRLREDFVIRLGCLLVSFAVLASLVLEPPRAKAEALTLAAVGGTALVAAYLGACGMMPYTTGMDRNGVNESVARMIQDFLDDTFSGGDEPSGGGNKPLLNDWLGMITFTVLNGVVRFGKEAADKLNQFAQWVAGKYGTKPGVNVVYGESGTYITLQDGNKAFLSTFTFADGQYSLSSQGTIFTNLPVRFSTGYYLDSYIQDGGIFYAVFNSDGSCNGGLGGIECTFTLGFNYDLSSKETHPFRLYHVYRGRWTSVYIYTAESFKKIFGLSVSIDESLSLDISDTMQEVLDRLMALEENQSIALDVGATQSMEIQEILQGILDAILAGDLAASAEIVDEAVEPEEPDPPVVPVVPEGLDKLGAALTSRFPFSIPWDVYKGVTLLAAPPKAPYFEVDFMAPIAYRVGGWKGSTKIVLDMSEYEIIGQVCRWTSTIGFCLMLATGTKRLIWTA